jgi:hypothetical protein
MPMNPNTDGDLLGLISTLTDEGQTLQLREVVDDFGPARVARVIRDGFAVVFQATDDEFWEAVANQPFDWPAHRKNLPIDEATELVQLDPVPLDYRIRGAPNALEMVGAPHLLLDYATDRRDAIAEVRARHGLA